MSPVRRRRRDKGKETWMITDVVNLVKIVKGGICKIRKIKRGL